MLFWLFLTCLDFAYGIEPRLRYLDAPKLVDIWATEPPGLYIKWHTVAQRADDPVIGYKIKIWEIEEEEDRRFELLNGEHYPGYLVNKRPVEGFNPNITQTSAPRDVIVQRSILTEFHIKDGIKENVLYEIRMLAFKIDMDGPMTEPRWFKIAKANNVRAVIQRSPTWCLVSIKTEAKDHEDTYPLIYNHFF